MKRMIMTIALTYLAMMLSGCPSGTSQSQLQKAATASEQAMIVVQGFQQGEILAYGQGKSCQASPVTTTCVIISDEDHLFIQQSLQTIFTLDKTVNTCIGTAGTKTAAVTCTDTAVASIDQLQAEGLTHIKSVPAKQDYSLVMISVKSALTIIKTMLEGS
jgi:hypothetical protein